MKKKNTKQKLTCMGEKHSTMLKLLEKKPGYWLDFMRKI